MVHRLCRGQQNANAVTVGKAIGSVRVGVCLTDWQTGQSDSRFLRRSPPCLVRSKWTSWCRGVNFLPTRLGPLNVEYVVVNMTVCSV